MNKNSLTKNSVDFIVSQAVPEYVNDLDATFEMMNYWLKPGAVMSHTIDLSSHGITKSWNGHWLFSEGEWKLVHGNHEIILNRAPLSAYLELNNKHHFEVLKSINYNKYSPLNKKNFAKKYRNLSEEDIKTNVVVLLSGKTCEPVNY